MIVPLYGQRLYVLGSLPILAYHIILTPCSVAFTMCLLLQTISVFYVSSLPFT
jgi:hypothetical protein